MATQRTNGPRANALAGRELVTRVTQACRAPAEVVWDVVAELPKHGAWGGLDGKHGGLEGIDAPTGRATVGTEFTSTGEDRMCRMADRSVVTEADRPTVFEFVTESSMELKRGGQSSDWTIVHRYGISPEGDGSAVSHTTRVTRASALPGALAMYRIPILRSIAMKETASQAKRGLAGLIQAAEERARARGKEG